MSALRSFALSAALCGLCVACGSLSIEQTRYDNPRVRALQSRSLHGIGAHPIAGQSLDAFFSHRVGLLEATNTSGATGRAAPISPDGYYLTAAHVVASEPFFLATFEWIQPIPPGVSVLRAEEHFEVHSLPGRLVWQSPDADLAVVHFPHRPHAYFSEFQQTPEIGSWAFSASDRGKILRDDRGHRIGNGPYRTAGAVLKLEDADPHDAWRIYETTLVGRGGMSGGPVVDADGALLGVTTTVQLYWHWERRKRTRMSFALPNPERIAAVIERDRHRRSVASPH